MNALSICYPAKALIPKFPWQGILDYIPASKTDLRAKFHQSTIGARENAPESDASGIIPAKPTRLRLDPPLPM